MSFSEELQFIADLFQPTTSLPPSDDFKDELYLRGAVAYLEMIGGSGEEGEIQQAVDYLYRVAGQTRTSEIQQQAFLALARLAETGNTPAIHYMYLLAIEDDHLAARQMILTKHWVPDRPELSSLFDWFTCLGSGSAYPEKYLAQITRAYFTFSSLALRKRLLFTAPEIKMQHWATILEAIETGSTDSLASLNTNYPAYNDPERLILIDLLKSLADSGSQPARDAICSLFIHHGDLQAKEIARQNHYFPEDLEMKAVFLFLAEDWGAYDALDFNRNLLTIAYEKAGRALRRRIMEHSRKTGQHEWLHGTGLAGETRWINDLTDADWDLAIQRLEDQKQLEDLWRLAQYSPPHWSAQILARLDAAGWLPSSVAEQEGFRSLAQLALDCINHPLTLRPKKKLKHPAGNITCLTIDRSGKKIAAGSTEQQIYLWNLPDGNLERKPLIGPVPLTRALAFSPNGENIVSAASDNRIRIFRWPEGQIQKTLDRHKAMIRSLIIDPDGRLLFSAGYDGSISYWRFPYGTEICSINTGSGEILSLALAARSEYLLSAGVDGKIYVWSVPGGAAIRQIVAHTGGITHLAAGSTNEFVASIGRDGFIRLWNYTNGGLVREWVNPYGTITGLAIHPSERVLVSGHQSGEVMLWSLSTGNKIENLVGHPHLINGLVFSPDGNTLYSSDNSGAVFVWDLQNLLSMRLPGIFSRPGEAISLQERLNKPQATTKDKVWLSFSTRLALWRQRFDIEISDLLPVQIGEFDIELS